MSERPRVLVLLANGENRRILQETLADRFDIVSNLGDARKNASESLGPFDLCVLDSESLRRSFDAIVHLRETFKPLYFPVLLLADRSSADARSAHVWQAIDDVLYRPVERVELVARVQALLRTRSLSIQARRLTSLYEHERSVAQRLQEAALPRVPVLPGLVIDAVYRPADDETRVGGDWYDALRLPDGRVVVTIGDVSGSGLNAAVTMLQMRQVLRAVAHVHSDPALMLDAAERTLAGEAEQKQITIFVGVIDIVTSELTYASAGHPPPIMRLPGGAAVILPCDGLLLGTPLRLPRSSTRREFPQDAMLVLYTDGVTEASRDPVEGERRLFERVRMLAHDEMQPALALADAMRAPTNADDVALVTIAHEPTRSETIRRWTLDAADARHARATQRELRLALAGRISAEAIVNAEMIFAELLGNVVRHTKGEVVVALDITSTNPVLHVLDRGPGFQHFPRLPSDLLSERGRGLFIVSRLADDFTISRRAEVGSHARVVLATEASRYASA